MFPCSEGGTTATSITPRGVVTSYHSTELGKLGISSSQAEGARRGTKTAMASIEGARASMAGER